MAKPGRKRKQANPFDIVMDFVDMIDRAFEKATGTTITDRLKEAINTPRQLPPGDEPAPLETDLSLANAYAILGLKPDATPELVKNHYRNLARLFHTDTGGMNDEAMKLINRAYETITKPEGER